VILGEPHPSNADVNMTLDDLFRRAAARHPSALALHDAPAGEQDGPPRRMTYAEADRAVAAIAARLRDLGLVPDDVVAVQLSNTSDSVLAVLGVLRAGLIASPLPLLWRRAETATAAARAGVKAIITGAGAQQDGLCDTAIQVAADHASIRHVCGFGPNLPHGVVPLDLAAEDFTDTAGPNGRDHAAGHVAAVTWEPSREGPIAVARSHAELTAAGCTIMLEAQLAPGTAILSAMGLGSFGGMVLTLMPWLLTGGSLSLHQPFDPETFIAQCRNDSCGAVIVPATVAHRLMDAGLMQDRESGNILAVWRTPEALPSSPAWRAPAIDLTDVLVFGETGLLAIRRGVDGRPGTIPVGTVKAPRGINGGIAVMEITRTAAGTVGLSGAMVPRHAFPPGAEAMAEAHLRADAAGVVDTGYGCRPGPDEGTLEITASPSGLVNIGGYRFAIGELRNLIRKTDRNAALSALPDAIAGHRLAGQAADAPAMRSALSALGLNPLIAGAFRNQQQR
jgi:hypothetical protein